MKGTALRQPAMAVMALTLACASMILTFPGLEGISLGASTVSDVPAGARVPSVSTWFELNQGQAAADVRFIARSADSTLLLEDDAAVMSFGTEASLRMTFEGASRTSVVGAEGLRGRVNHLVGDQEEWITDVPTYERVRYEGLYEGVDLDFYGQPNAFEYDFIVAPGADPAQILLGFDASGLSIGPSGDLLLTVGDRVVRQTAPVTYQLVDGKRRTVESAFRRVDANTIGFHVGTYDRSESLVIDPKVDFSMLIGGEGIETGQGLAVDKEGFVYAGGETDSLHMTTAGEHADDSWNGAIDAFLLKVDPRTAEIVWATYFGGASWDALHRQSGLVLDNDGNVYAAGFTYSPDFPTTAGAYRENLEGRGQEAWVAKFSPSGELIYSTLVGGTSGPLEGARAMAVDDAGRAYITGTMGSDDLEVRRGFQEEAAGTQDSYLAVLTPDGSDLYFSTYLGGNDHIDPDEVRQGRVGILEDGQGLALAPDGIAWVIGFTDALDFPTTPDAFMPTNPGGRSYFLSAIDVHAGELVYSTYLGGPGEDGNLTFQAGGVAVDPRGNVYVVGNTRMNETQARSFPIRNAFDSTYNGGWDVFVMKFDAGHQLVYSTFLGGKQDDVANSIAVGSSQSPHIVGKTVEAPTPPANVSETFLEGRAGEPLTPRGGGADGYIVKLTPCGDTVDYWSFMGGSSSLDRTPLQGTLASEETALVVTLDRWESAFVTGLMTTSNFQPRPANRPGTNGPWDAFIVKFSDDPGNSNAYPGPPIAPGASSACGSNHWSS